MTGRLTIAEYRERVRARVQERYPDWTLSDSDGDGGREAFGLAVALGDGARVHIGIANAYGHYEHGHDLDASIANLLAALAVGESLRKYELVWANAREHLMVQLTTACDDDDLAPPNRRVGRPWQGDLVLRPVLDLPEVLIPVMAYHLTAWGVTLDTALDVGIARTRERLAASPGGSTPVVVVPCVMVTVWDNDLPGYTATSAVWPDLALPALPAGRGYGVVCAPDRDYCVSLLTADLGDPATVLGSIMLTELVRQRVGQPRPLMAPGLVFCRPGGSYEYQSITPEGAAPDEASA
jgi:hypothetical protein